jgi:hypothetical protein
MGRRWMACERAVTHVKAARYVRRKVGGCQEHALEIHDDCAKAGVGANKHA